MTELIDELGPVGWVVVEFPGSRFNSEIPLKISAGVPRLGEPMGAPFASAVRRAGGQLVVNGRIRYRHVEAHAVQWSLKKKESYMPLVTRKMASASANGPAPVATSATPVATAAVVGSSMADRFMDEIETRA
jgi:hypothetical protein